MIKIQSREKRRREKGLSSLGAVGGGQVQEQVRAQGRQPQDEQGLEPAVPAQVPAQERSGQGEERQGQQRVGKPPMIADKGQTVPKDKKVIHVRQHCEDGPGQRGPPPGGRRQQLGADNPGGQVGQWIHGHLPPWVP